MYRTVSFFWLASLLLLHPSHAAVYKVVDEHGNVTYTDTPPANGPRAEPVELPLINTQQPIEVRPRTDARVVTAPEEDAVPYRRAVIRSPADGFTLPMGQPSLTVEVSLEPALQQGHWVQILKDGAAAGSPAQNITQELPHPERGTHFISAQVLDGRGRVLAETDPVTVHVQRPVVTEPGSPRDPRPRPPGAPQAPSAPN